MNHIVIIGFMGSGKTRVGKRLAKDYGLPFIDLDKEIAARMKMSVNEIFKKFGEPFYRAMETLVIKELLEEKEQKVISLGAAFPMQEQNEEFMRSLGLVIYLKGSAKVLLERLRDTNPTLMTETGEEKIVKLLNQRDPVYTKYADIQAVTGIKPFDGLVEEIEEKINVQKKEKI